MKTPEEMAEEYAKTEGQPWGCEQHFLAGYKAAMNENKQKVQELEANWKFCCEDKARLLNELAAAERAKEQVADVSKVMCNTTMEEIKAIGTVEIIPITNLPTPAKWISVKDRLPEERVWVLGYYSRYKHEETFVVGLVQRYVHSWAGANIWMTDIADGALSYEEVQSITHWQPLPAPPKEEK